MTMEQAYSLVEGAQRLRYLRQLEAMARKPKTRQKRAILTRARRRRLRAHVLTVLTGMAMGAAFAALMTP